MNHPDPDSESRPNKFLPTNRITFPRQLDLLRAWAAVSGPSGRPVSNKEVADVVGMKPKTTSLANAFFVQTGFLKKTDAGFTPAQEVLSFSRAHEWNPKTSSEKLGSLVMGSWFAKALRPRLGYGSISKKEALQTLAEACHAGPRFESRLVFLLDYLEAAGLASRKGDQLSAAKSANGDPPESPVVEVAAPEEKPEPASERAPLTTSFTQSTKEGTVQFHVGVKVDMTEFKGWSADRITAFFGGIAQVLAAKSGIEEEASSEQAN